jgi:RNA polymerase sigma-70 factor, ECF subfamily
LFMTDSDGRLAQAAANGDRDAFSELLKRHGPGVRRDLARRLGSGLRSAVDVEDVMQVTYLEAFLRITRFVPQGDGSFAAWLLNIARNNLRDAARGLRCARRPQLRLRVALAAEGNSSSPLPSPPYGPSDTPSGEAACQERQEILHLAMTRLPEDYRRVVELCDIEGKPTCEAAEVLRRSQGAVCMLRARAHDRLRELLGSESQYFSDSG